MFRSPVTWIALTGAIVALVLTLLRDSPSMSKNWTGRN